MTIHKQAMPGSQAHHTMLGSVLSLSSRILILYTSTILTILHPVWIENTFAVLDVVIGGQIDGQ